MATLLPMVHVDAQTFAEHFTAYGPVVNTAPPGWVKSPAAGPTLGPDSSISGYVLSNFAVFTPGSDGDNNFVQGHQLGSVREGFQRTVTGLTIGRKYLLTFDHAAPMGWGFTSPAYWSVIRDGVEIDTSSAVPLQASGPIQWTSHVTLFTATANIHTIGFDPVGPTGDTNAYIDNIQLKATVAASATFRNGSGVNPPDYTSVTLPILGGSWQTSVGTNPTTLFTVVALGLAGPAQTPLLGGELLIEISPVPAMVTGFGAHSLPIPAGIATVGFALPTQAIRVDNVSGAPTPVLLNALDLVLGF